MGVAMQGCTSRRRNAHRTEEREVLYRFHPWSGCVVHVHEAIDKASGAMVRCSRDDASGRWLELPIWMFDRASCALIEVVAAPRVDLTALGALIALLRETERADGASSNARLSGAAMGTHNPNRGETHATVDECPSRSSRRTAAIRPVRVGKRRRHEEDARMARPSCGDAPDPDPSHGAPDPRTRGRRLRSTSGGNAP
jgi:hypothetical protein